MDGFGLWAIAAGCIALGLGIAARQVWGARHCPRHHRGAGQVAWVLAALCSLGGFALALSLVAAR